jgi:2-dehydropantoate 2-reductase
VNILIFGAGAIGGLVGGRLALAGHRVCLVARPAVIEAVAQHGLRLALPASRGEQTVRDIGLAESASAAWAFDLVILTVKSYDTASAIAALQAIPRTPILSLQNGVGNEEALAAAFGPEGVIAGTITIPVSTPTPGRIVQERARGGIGLAGLTPQADLDPWAEVLGQAGFRVVTYRDYRAMKWSKLLLNLIANASVAILGCAPGAIFTDPRLFRLERAMLRETLAVMDAIGLRVVAQPGYATDWLAWAIRALPAWLLRPLLQPLVAGGRGAKPPSLALGMARGRSEVGWLNGAVVRYGQQAGVPTPVNAALTEALEGIVSGRVDAALYRRDPERLLREAGL